MGDAGDALTVVKSSPPGSIFAAAARTRNEGASRPWHARAGEDRAMRVAVATVAAPWGVLHIAASGRGLLALEHLASDEDFFAGLERRLGSRAIQAVSA